MKQPNGIVGTPDGRTLYVADIGAGKTYAYDIQKDGALTNKRLFCELGSDGMTSDEEGHVYLTGKGVTVFDRTGKEIEHIEVKSPGRQTSVLAGGLPHTFHHGEQGLLRDPDACQGFRFRAVICRAEG